MEIMNKTKELDLFNLTDKEKIVKKGKLKLGCHFFRQGLTIILNKKSPFLD
jgi:hypothetical protein